jgi:DNA-binding NtrC family response regulator
MKIRILFVDSAPSAYRYCKKILGENFQIWFADCQGAAAVIIREMIEKNKKPALIITNAIVNDNSAVELVRELRKIFPKTPIIGWSVYTEYKEKILATGANEFVERHINERLPQVVRSILKQNKKK